MREILSALIHIAQRTGRFTVVETTALYDRLWALFGFAILACAGAFMLNAWLGWKAPSLVLAIAFTIAAVYVWAKPLHILVVVGLGGALGLAKKIAGDSTLATEIGEALKIYLGFLKWVLLAGVTFLFITGTVSFKGNPGAILPILTALGVIGLFIWVWPDVFLSTWGRRLVYGYAVLVIAWSFAGLVVPSSWWPGWLTGAGKERQDAQMLSIPLASSAQASWTKLVIPAGVGGKSALIPVPPGMYIVMAGNKFLNHTVYRDGSECSFVGTPCPNGAVAGNYATNEATEANIVSYAFAPVVQ